MYSTTYNFGDDEKNFKQTMPMELNFRNKIPKMF